MYYEGDEVIEAGHYLKYHLCFTPPRLAAYQYADHLTGEKRRTSTHIALPDEVIVEPLYFQEEIGKPRWIIEMWRDAGDFGVFDREGYYHLLTVQREPINPITGMGPYREIDRDILDVLKGMIWHMENMTEGESEARRHEDDAKEKERKHKAQEAVWEQREEQYEHAIRGS